MGLQNPVGARLSRVLDTKLESIDCFTIKAFKQVDYFKRKALMNCAERALQQAGETGLLAIPQSDTWA